MNNPDFYIYVITALLPLSAAMLVFQVNPYHALALRGILGAVAAMLYAVLGAADVSLTEALMGTMLAITLYAIAVRSSLVMRLGILEEQAEDSQFEQLIKDIRTVFGKHHMRLELVPYTNTQALQRALIEKDIHTTCIPSAYNPRNAAVYGSETQPYRTVTRVKRLYEIMQAELSAPSTSVNYVSITDLSATEVTKSNLEEQPL